MNLANISLRVVCGYSFIREGLFAFFSLFSFTQQQLSRHVPTPSTFQLGIRVGSRELILLYSLIDDIILGDLSFMGKRIPTGLPTKASHLGLCVLFYVP